GTPSYEKLQRSRACVLLRTSGKPEARWVKSRRGRDPDLRKLRWSRACVLLRTSGKPGARWVKSRRGRDPDLRKRRPGAAFRHAALPAGYSSLSSADFSPANGLSLRIVHG